MGSASRRRKEELRRAAKQQKRAIQAAAAEAAELVRAAAPDAGTGKAELPRDLPLVRRAVRERWPIPEKRRSRIAEQIAAMAEGEGKGSDVRVQIEAARVVVAMDAMNLRAEEVELKRKELDTHLADELDRPLLDSDTERAILTEIARQEQPGGPGHGSQPGPLATSPTPDLSE